MEEGNFTEWAIGDEPLMARGRHVAYWLFSGEGGWNFFQAILGGAPKHFRSNTKGPRYSGWETLF